MVFKKPQKTKRGTLKETKEVSEKENRINLEIEKSKLEMELDESMRLFVDKSSR